MKNSVDSISRKLQKKVKLEVSGDEITIHRKMVDPISEVLMHLFRNSVDHGIESEKIRTESGKSEEASIRLEFHHDSGRTTIQLRDDGKGLDPDEIRSKAVDRGIISKTEAKNLTQKEVIQLISNKLQPP